MSARDTWYAASEKVDAAQDALIKAERQRAGTADAVVTDAAANGTPSPGVVAAAVAARDVATARREAYRAAVQESAAAYDAFIGGAA